jgi:dienelactone hydrolase
MRDRQLTAYLAAMVIWSGLPAFSQAQKFAFPAPAPDVRVTSDILYGRADTTVLAMDVYQRRRISSALRPALVFFNRARGPGRKDPYWAAWARTAASRDIVAIIPDLRDGTEANDFRALLDYLMRRGTALGIDTAAVAVYAASGNVSTAFPIVEEPDLKAIKAAVIYYGAAPITDFRRDLPVLYVRAGLDRPAVNQDITALAALAITQNAPVTLLNYPTGYHAFELFNDNAATRAVIEETLAFVTRTTAHAYQTSLRAGLVEATAAGQIQTGKFHEAASTYAELVRQRPNDPRLALSYGEALLGDGQVAPACAAFAMLRGRGLGPRDLGVPAARACALAGDTVAAIAWLASIPSRFRPPALVNDSAFAGIRSRSDFLALFRSP